MWKNRCAADGKGARRQRWASRRGLANYKRAQPPNHDHSLGSTGTDKSGRRSRPAHPQTPPVAEKTIRKKKQVPPCGAEALLANRVKANRHQTPLPMLISLPCFLFSSGINVDLAGLHVLLSNVFLMKKNMSAPQGIIVCRGVATGLPMLISRVNSLH